MAILRAGELRLKKGGDETAIAVSGGILQVESDQVRVLADAAEHAEEIDEARAREALERARQAMIEAHDRRDMAGLQAAVERANVRIRVAERRRRRPPEAPPA